MSPPDTAVRSLEVGVAWVLGQSQVSDRHEWIPSPAALRIKLFADDADRAGMLEMYRNPLIKGFTTNPTLMRKAGVTDYPALEREIVAAIPDRPISFEAFPEVGKDLDEFSLDTVKMFRDDAVNAGFRL